MTDTRPHPSAAPDIAAAIVGAAQLALAGYIARYGPTGPLPMHFAADGTVNRWGSRFEAVTVLVVLAALTFGIDAAFAIARRQTRDEGVIRSQAIGRGLFLFIMVSVSVLAGALGLGQMTHGGGRMADPRLFLALIWLVIAVTGAAMGKLGPNRFGGVRVYWTFHSRLAWDKANRLLGRIFFLGGLAGLLSLPFLAVRQSSVLLAAVTIAGAVLPIAESWRVWRTDPDRT